MKNKNILLMRGLIREGRHWGEFKNKLQAALPDYQVHTLDIPGNGQLYKLRSFTSIKQNVQFLRDQWKKRIDYPSENILVSMSLGGMIAMEWSTLYPEDWKKAILINSSHGALSPFYHRMKIRNIPKFLRYLLSLNQQKKQEIIFGLIVNDPANKKQAVEEWTHIARTAPVSIINTLRQMFAAIKYRSISPTMSLPMHIIACKNDNLVGVECSERIAKHWNVNITYHETAGHDPSVESGDWLVDEIKKQIKS